MKLSQLSILFVGFILIIVVETDINTENLRAAAESRIEMDYYMDQAMESAVDSLMQIEASTGNEVINKDKAVESFLSSMYASLGILSDPLAQEKFRAFIPVIAVTDEDGYYLMYDEAYTGTDGFTYLSRRWTEKKPYVYEDSHFIYRFTLGSDLILYDKYDILDPSGRYKVFETGIENIKKDSDYSLLRSLMGNASFLLNDELFTLVRSQSIAALIEKDFSWYISLHNNVAEHFGIRYRFSLPAADISEWNKALEGKGIIIIFQGMPLTESGSQVYNRMAFSGAGIRKGNIYYIEQHSWYYIYHKEGCPLINGNPNIKEEHHSSVEECASLGAYACEVCDPAGIHAPSYSP